MVLFSAIRGAVGSIIEPMEIDPDVNVCECFCASSIAAFKSEGQSAFRIAMGTCISKLRHISMIC